MRSICMPIFWTLLTTERTRLIVCPRGLTEDAVSDEPARAQTLCVVHARGYPVLEAYPSGAVRAAAASQTCCTRGALWSEGGRGRAAAVCGCDPVSNFAAPAATRAFRATADDIIAIDGWMEQIGAQWGIPERVVFRARVCIGEVAANVREHGGSRTGSDQIIITLRNRAPAVEIELIDGGLAFNPIDRPVAAPAESNDSETDGGRGLLLLHSYASGMEYRREPDRNVLRFRVLAP
jgi:anti-sigma regulatory factor (Ser/Thr protein kinase)